MHTTRHQLTVSCERINAIGVVSSAGVEDVHLHEGNVNGDVFEDFVRTSLLPMLMPFNGINSVVILDNASLHHMESVTAMINVVGALVRFLPPYSPDLNPIEEVFSKVKSVLKANDDVYIHTFSPRSINT